VAFVDPVFEVDTSRIDGQALVGFCGELDLAGFTQAHLTTVDVLDQTSGALILDLSRLTYCDSSGIHLLLKLQAETQARGREMKLRNLQPVVARVLDVAGVRDDFVIED
jgi:anti-sigma B factor antagonist